MGSLLVKQENKGGGAKFTNLTKRVLISAMNIFLYFLCFEWAIPWGWLIRVNAGRSPDHLVACCNFELHCI